KKFADRLPEYGAMPEDKAADLVRETDQVFKKSIQPEIESYIQGKFMKGSSATPLDTRLAEKVYRNCLPYFTSEINKIRKETIQEKKDLLATARNDFEKIDITGFRSSPEKPRTASKTTLEMTFSRDPEKFVQEAEERLKKQGAVNPSLFLRYSWKILPIDPK